VKASAVSEFGQLVGEIAAEASAAHVDIADLVNRYAPMIAAARDASVAEALNDQATFYWEASTLLDPARAIAERNGEESMAAVIDAQITTMREVSTRLRRRAAEFAGGAEDQAIHAMVSAPPEAFRAIVHPGERWPTTSKGLAGLGLAGVADELSKAYFLAHPHLDPARTSLEFRNGEQGWYVVGHEELAQAPGWVPSPGGECCACCAVADGKCYCDGSAESMCQCKPCKKAREDLK
jgi:hypothetical protein